MTLHINLKELAILNLCISTTPLVNNKLITLHNSSFTLYIKYHSRNPSQCKSAFKYNFTPSKCTFNNSIDKFELRNLRSSHVDWSSKDVIITDNKYNSWYNNLPLISQ